MEESRPRNLHCNYLMLLATADEMLCQLSRLLQKTVEGDYGGIAISVYCF